MEDGRTKQLLVPLGVTALAGGILVCQYLRSRSKVSGNKNLLVRLDSPTDQSFHLIQLNEQATFENLLQDLCNRFQISNPRIFQNQNGCELNSNTFKSITDAILIVTNNDQPMIHSTFHKFLPIPRGPPPKPWIGNISDIRPNLSVSSIGLMEKYGTIFPLKFPSPAGDVIFVADPVLVEEIFSDPIRWPKLHMKSFFLRGRIGDGLFTSDDDEEIWHVAHRILLPAFSAKGMRQYFEMVLDCADLLDKKFTELSQTEEWVDINEWSTRFTLEVIGRVAFGINFNSFQEHLPFLDDLDNAFCENLLTAWQKMIPSPSRTRLVNDAWKNINQFIQNIIDTKREEIQRDESAKNKKDLITLMLCAIDPVTKTSLPNDNIRSQVLTFLVAGHDSTSTAITSLMFHLSSNPEVERKVLEELQRVIGDGPLEWKHLAQLEYCTQVLKETLRLLPPAGAIRKTSITDQPLGPYLVKKNVGILVPFWALHYNPTVWPNPTRFDPDRFSKENTATRNPFAWLPFSTGPRGCIGSQLSIMEQKVFLATIYRRYAIRLHHTAKIDITFPLFAKAHGVHMVISPRFPLGEKSRSENVNHSVKSQIPTSDDLLNNLKKNEDLELPTEMVDQHRVFILYGSNLETSSSFAQVLESHAHQIGFQASLMSLDEFTQSEHEHQTIRSNQDQTTILVITSTYNGTPPDNAVNFKNWITTQRPSVFSGVRYSVFGCGNSQWKTFQAFPRLVDQTLEDLGATRIFPLGEGDADQSIDDDFSLWALNFWSKLQKNLGRDQIEHSSTTSNFPQYQVEIIDPSSSVDQKRFEKQNFSQFCELANANQAFFAPLLTSKELQKSELTSRSTVHLEFQLPDHVSYEAGDHLAVFGFNPPELVEWAGKVLKVSLDDLVQVRSDSGGRSGIPQKMLISVRELFECFLELQAPVIRSQLAYLASKTECPPEKRKLEALSSQKESSSANVTNSDGELSFEEYIIRSKRTILEVLVDFPSVSLSLSEFLSIVPLLKPRHYSISSSGKQFPHTTHITVGVLKGVSPVGRKHLGVCSNYLANGLMLSNGFGAIVSVKDTKSTFRLPSSGEVPIIMVGAGTGLAPFRGFLQERRIANATGKCALFFGCCTENDYLYAEELSEFVEQKVLTHLHVAFSRKQAHKVYVQHLIVEQASQVNQLLQEGAYIYVCGDARSMAPEVRQAFCKVVELSSNVSSSQAEEYLSQLFKSGRYFEDVWAS